MQALKSGLTRSTFIKQDSAISLHYQEYQWQSLLLKEIFELLFYNVKWQNQIQNAFKSRFNPTNISASDMQSNLKPQHKMDSTYRWCLELKGKGCEKENCGGPVTELCGEDGRVEREEEEGEEEAGEG